MMKRFICSLLFCGCSLIIFAQPTLQSIYVEVRVNKTPVSKPVKDYVNIGYRPFDSKPWKGWEWNSQPKDKAVWSFQTDQPWYIVLNSLSFANKNNSWLLEPGDSVIFHYLDGKLSFSGRGIEKLRLIDDLANINEGMAKPYINSYHLPLLVPINNIGRGASFR